MSFIHISKSRTGKLPQFEASAPSAKKPSKTKAFLDEFKLATADPAKKSWDALKKIEKPTPDEDSLDFLDQHFKPLV